MRGGLALTVFKGRLVLRAVDAVGAYENGFHHFAEFGPPGFPMPPISGMGRAAWPNARLDLRAAE